VVLVSDWSRIWTDPLERPDVVIDNYSEDRLGELCVDPAELAKRNNIPWVSMRDEMGGQTCDVIAQARSWFEYGPWMPFYAGDTTSGLWLAFKAINAYLAGEPGHFVLGQASCLQKLVEGELIVDVERQGGVVPWETGQYQARRGEAVATRNGKTYRETVRDRSWKLENLWHDNGRINI
jgi:hypothetical protein